MQQPNWGIGRLIFLDFYKHTDTHTHTQTVGLLWTSDQPVAKAATYTTHNEHNRRNSMSSTGFETTITAVQRQQNDALENTATWVGFVVPTLHELPLRWLNENKDWRSVYQTCQLKNVYEFLVSVNEFSGRLDNSRYSWQNIVCTYLNGITLQN